MTDEHRAPEDDFPAVPRRLRVSQGLELAGDAYGRPGASPVLLLHGGGQTRHSWTATARRLAREGWYALAVDLRGHGDSDWSPEGDYTHTSFAADTTTLARVLADEAGELPVLVGASLGGISSLLAIGAASEPLVRALVLVDIATRLEPSGASRIIEFMRSKVDGFESLEEAAEAIAAYNPHRPRPRSLEGLRKNLRRHDDGRYRWHWDPAFVEGRPHVNEGPGGFSLLDEAASRLDMPTLLVRGKLSDLLSEEGARTFLEQVPHAQFADVSDAGHMVAGDRNDRFGEAMMEFLNTAF